MPSSPTLRLSFSPNLPSKTYQSLTQISLPLVHFLSIYFLLESIFSLQLWIIAVLNHQLETLLLVLLLLIASFLIWMTPYTLPELELEKLLNATLTIFTNSDRIHAVKTLDRLGIRDCFERIICFESMNPNLSDSTHPNEFPVVLKPSLEAMNIALDAAKVDPHRTLFLDDSVRNVAAGKAVGLLTVLVGKSTKTKEADYALETVTNLVQVVPEIWFTGGDDKRIGSTRGEMDSAFAATVVGV